MSGGGGSGRLEVRQLGTIHEAVDDENGATDCSHLHHLDDNLLERRRRMEEGDGCQQEEDLHRYSDSDKVLFGLWHLAPKTKNYIRA